MGFHFQGWVNSLDGLAQLIIFILEDIGVSLRHFLDVFAPILNLILEGIFWKYIRWPPSSFPRFSKQTISYFQGFCRI
jgi:hypothetical protein